MTKAQTATTITAETSPAITPTPCYPRHQLCHAIQWDGTRSGIKAIREMLASGVAVRADKYGNLGLATITTDREWCFAVEDYVVVDAEGSPITVCSAVEFERWFEVQPS